MPRFAPVYVKCDACGETMTERQSKGHANTWGHYTFNSGTINHSRYPGQDVESIWDLGANAGRAGE